jgi:RNA polymerase sigma factor for flagellar operon FliA
MEEDAMPRQRQQELSNEDVAALWQAYAAKRPIPLRDRLVEHYLDADLVRRIAKRMARALPQQVDPDELLSAGAFGLLSAVERFDPSRGNKFETFAGQPIRGAMLDYLREIDHLSRVARRHANKLIATTERLRMRLGRAPAEEEIRRQLDVSRETLLSMSRTTREGITLSLEHRKANRHRDEAGSIATVDTIAADEDASSSLRAAMRHDVRAWITSGLSRRHRLIIVLYYYEAITMREVGDTLGMSESRVSQLHANIIQRLKRKLRGRDGELAAVA